MRDEYDDVSLNENCFLTYFGISELVSFFEDRFVIFCSFIFGTLFNSNVSSPAWRMMYSVSRWNVSILAINVKLMLQGVQN